MVPCGYRPQVKCPATIRKLKDKEVPINRIEIKIQINSRELFLSSSFENRVTLLEECLQPFNAVFSIDQIYHYFIAIFKAT